MILLGVSGKRGTGKTLLASILNKKYGFIDFPFASELKSAVRRDFDLTVSHTDGWLKEVPLVIGETPITPREIMIRYGQFFRSFSPNWWVEKTFSSIDQIIRLQKTTGASDALRATISDVRFPNEAQAIKERGGFVIRLNRPQELNIYQQVSTDASEVALDDYNDFDLELPEEYNKVPKDLEDFAETVMKFIEVRK